MMRSLLRKRALFAEATSEAKTAKAPLGPPLSQYNILQSGRPNYCGLLKEVGFPW